MAAKNKMKRLNIDLLKTLPDSKVTENLFKVVKLSVFKKKFAISHLASVCFRRKVGINWQRLEKK